MKSTGRKAPRFTGFLLILLLSLNACSFNLSLPWGESESEDPAVLAALLFLLGSNRSNGSSSGECSNTSGMVICVPGGLAE